jgi:peroxiredoxin
MWLVRRRGRLAGGAQPLEVEGARPPEVEGVLIGEDEQRIPMMAKGEHVLIPVQHFERVTGWSPTLQGLCRGAQCLPWRVEPADPPGFIDVAAACGLADIPVAHENGPTGPVVVIGRPSSESPLWSHSTAPDVELTSLDGQPARLSTWAGQRRVLLAFASWCGCRDDLPAWQALLDGIDEAVRPALVAIAVDETADAVTPLVLGVRFPVLLDRDRRFCEAYGVRHVPTVLWVGADDRLVRPHQVAFADDRLYEFHGLQAAEHHNALRQWLDGEPTTPTADDILEAPTPEQQQARLEFRLAVHLLRAGARELAQRHLEIAGRLSPDDFTIRRAAIALMGGDPLGEDFLPLYEEWLVRTGGRFY